MPNEITVSLSKQIKEDYLAYSMAVLIGKADTFSFVATMIIPGSARDILSGLKMVDQLSIGLTSSASVAHYPSTKTDVPRDTIGGTMKNFRTESYAF